MVAMAVRVRASAECLRSMPHSMSFVCVFFLSRAFRVVNIEVVVEERVQATLGRRVPLESPPEAAYNYKEE